MFARRAGRNGGLEERVVQDEVQAYQARMQAFAAKVEAFAATLTEEERAWLTGIIAVAASSDAAVSGYGAGPGPVFDINVGNPVINLNLNLLTQTAIGLGNLGNVGNLGALGQLGGAGPQG